MRPNYHRHLASKLVILVISAISVSTASAILIQPHNYMLDDSALLADQQQPHNQQPSDSIEHSQHGHDALSPFYADQAASGESSADKDIVSMIGHSLERLRLARTLEQQQQSQQNQEAAMHLSHFSPEIAELIQHEHKAANAKQAADGDQPQSFSASVANVLMNVAQAASDASSQDQLDNQQASQASGQDDQSPEPASLAPAAASKSELKSGPIQWYNPKETIPVLKISSMATPSKYKKVYFRSEKKLVDGAFHSVKDDEQDDKKLIKKSFMSGVQRRSSKGTSSSVAPPGIFQDGVIDFLRKFRDVYVQTRSIAPATGASSGSSSAASSATSGASSAIAALLAPASRPTLVGALSAASSLMGGASQVAQAASPSSSSGSSSSGAAVAALASQAASSVAAGAANAVASGAAQSGSGSSGVKPLTAQSYVSFWSKTFPNWVRKMLKQMRRRSLQNHNRRQKQQHSIGHASQAAASGAVASVVESVGHSALSGSSSGSTR